MTKISVICIAVILLSLLTLIFSYFGYPVGATNDGAWYIVPGIRFAEVHTLDNPIAWTGDHAHGNGPFLAFTPLFPLFLSIFLFPGAPIPLPVQVFMVIAVVNVIVIAISAWVLYVVATMKGRPLNWAVTTVICTALFMILRASWGFNGRPEVLVRLFFTVGFLFVLRMRWSWRLSAALGVLLGIIAAANPFEPILVFALIGFTLSLEYDFRTCLMYLAIVTAIGFLSFAAVMQLSPYSIASTLGGIRGHGAQMLGVVSPWKTVLDLLKSSYVVVYGVIGIPLFLFGVRLFLQALKKKQIVSPYLLVLCILIAAAFVSVAIATGRSYYIPPFLLLVFAGFLYYIVHVNSSKLVTYASIFLFVLLVAVSLKDVVLFPFFLHDGRTLPAARTQFAEVIAQDPKMPISLGGSQAWMLSDAYSSMISGDPSLVPGVRNYLLLQEEEAHPQFQEKIDSCALRNNFYTAKIPKIFGIPLGRVTPGYGFAAYNCHT